MSINSILSTALSGLTASQAALRQTSNNVANVNTDGYARTQVNITARNVAGEGLGVTSDQVTRITDRFLQAASLSAASDASSWEARSDTLDRIQSQFGTMDDNGSVFARLNKVFSDIGLAAQYPTSAVQKMQAVNSAQSLFDEFSRLDGQIRTARGDVQQQVNQSVDRINELLGHIQGLNQSISQGTIAGDPTGAQNQQAALIDELSGLIDIRVDTNETGGAVIRTQNGVQLLGGIRVELQHSTGAGGAPGTDYGRITATNTAGGSVDLQAAISGGSLHGLLQLRDGDLREMQLELAELASGAADTLNQAHADATAFPPPTNVQGRNTGLLASDALNFSGQTFVVVTDNAGASVSQIKVDFSAGTLSVDGGAAIGIGSTIGSFTAALNSALGGNGTASFTGGQLSISATGSNGIGFSQSDAAPSDRAGRSFAAFFGLNDLVTSAKPTFFETGLSASDAHGFASGQSLTFSVATADGRAVSEINIPVAGANMQDMLNALNDPATGLGRFETFALDANGKLVSTPTIGAENYKVSLREDTTSRTGTDISFSGLFGVGDMAQGNRTAALGIRNDIARNPDRLALGKLALTSISVPGDIVISNGDGRGGFALQQAVEQARSFNTAGSLSASTSTLTEFAGRLAAATGSRAASADRELQAAQTLQTEADARRANLEGVNMDEELANMTMFQQSYNAAARLIQAAKELNDTLINMV